MTAPRSLAAGLAAAVMAVAAVGCDAPLDPDRDQPPEAGTSPTSTPTQAPPAASLAPSPPAPSVQAGRVEAQARKAQRRAARIAARRAAEQVATPVVAISVDGLNPSALTELGPDRLPNFFALIDGGASTLNARTELEITETLPNHTGMLTGRPIEGPTGHGVDFNEDRGGTVSSHAGRRIASIFDVVHGAGRSTALYASKSKFTLYQRSWAASIDRSVIEEDNQRLVGQLVADLSARPAQFSFVHLSAPDKAGHASGFMGAAYLRAVEEVDGLLGRIRDAAGSSAGRSGATLIVTADHGGRGTGGHSSETDPEDYRIPFIVAGPAARPGSDLYSLNPDYRDPGAGRPSYAGSQPVRNGDLADLATRMLGLPPVPGSVFGARDRLDIR